MGNVIGLLAAILMANSIARKVRTKPTPGAFGSEKTRKKKRKVKRRSYRCPARWLARWMDANPRGLNR